MVSIAVTFTYFLCNWNLLTWFNRVFGSPYIVYGLLTTVITTGYITNYNLHTSSFIKSPLPNYFFYLYYLSRRNPIVEIHRNVQSNFRITWIQENRWKIFFLFYINNTIRSDKNIQKKTLNILTQIDMVIYKTENSNSKIYEYSPLTFCDTYRPQRYFIPNSNYNADFWN